MKNFLPSVKTGQTESVMVAGLDMDYLGKPFGPIPGLVAIAEFVTKVHAICMKCGNLANYSHRTVANSSRILLGEQESYVPLCACFNERAGKKICDVEYRNFETYYSIEQIAEIVGGQLILNDAGDNRISDLLTDTEKLFTRKTLCFCHRRWTPRWTQIHSELVVQGSTQFHRFRIPRKLQCPQSEFYCRKRSACCNAEARRFSSSAFSYPCSGHYRGVTEKQL